jgi:hypothetical protein
MRRHTDAIARQLRRGCELRRIVRTAAQAVNAADNIHPARFPVPASNRPDWRDVGAVSVSARASAAPAANRSELCTGIR